MIRISVLQWSQTALCRACSFVLLIIGFSGSAIAIPIIYYDLDFEDGTLGGGVASGSFGTPTVVSPSNLDNNAAEFVLIDQLVWDRNAAESSTHHVGFDYFAEAGANITQFLDVPSILRLDVSDIGRHRVDVYYDLNAQNAIAFLDGIVDSSLLSILAWPAPAATVSNQIRIANQAAPPGNSTGVFQIDNLIWEGNITFPVAVPEPTTLALLSLGLAGIGFCRRKKPIIT